MKPALSVDLLAEECVSIAVRYHLVARTWASWGSMVDEIWGIVIEAERASISQDSLLARLQVELSARFDGSTAGRLHREFKLLIDAMSETCPDWMRSMWKVPLKVKRLASIRPSAAGIPGRSRKSSLRIFLPTS
ncbi:hypothetical protein P12x_000951 [Tundrisphaera lichenicola]|uniref:hypothetical protein n=1 Tax=Tundrisphaera lichenicola TaxID=2029860 RepID=UPI003EB766C2